MRKALGIVRRIDDLGRVVIPMETRRVLRIKAGDPLEMYTNDQGELVIKKYEPLTKAMEIADIAERLSKGINKDILITDKGALISAHLVKSDAGEAFTGELDTRLANALTANKPTLLTNLKVTTEATRVFKNALVYPITDVQNEIIGSIIIGTNNIITDTDKTVASIALGLIGSLL